MWNVNGFSAATRQLWDTERYLRELDILILLETQRPAEAEPLLSDYDHFYVGAPVAGRRGYGLSVYVRPEMATGVSVWQADTELSVLWLRCPGQLFGVSAPVFLAACYVPPVGSQRLSVVPADERFARLSVQIGEAQQAGHVLLCGDFNASVCTSDQGGHRGVSGHGRALVAMCESCDLGLWTGVVPGDVPVVCSFASRVHTNASRPDHVLGSHELLPQVLWLCVDQARLDSDHFPLRLDCRCADGVARRCGAASTVHNSGLTRLRWDSECADEYQTVILQAACLSALQQSKDAVGSGDLDGAAQGYMQALFRAAEDAGMMISQSRVSQRTGQAIQRGRSQAAPWFDEECDRLKRCVMDARRSGDSEHLRCARRRFNSVAQRKRRAHRRKRMQQLLGEISLAPKRFWDAFKPKAQELPSQLQNPAAWTQPMQRALNPEVPEHLEPGIMEGSPPPADGTALTLPITAAEVRQAFAKLKNYKSSGCAGCPTELFKYAILEEDADSPLPPEADMASNLAELLNAVFCQGIVPESWNAVLVIPVFKRGDRLDTRNYRPISVGEVYAKLYATILNARLVDWLESNNLRAPCQAGFRPHLSTEHQIFALQHLIDECRRKKLPLFACFLDFSKAYDTVPRDLLWHVMRSIGVPEQFVAAVQSMYLDIRCMVAVSGVVGPAFSSHVGVKQGCPLSPTLFGIFIDRFYFMTMARTSGQVGPCLASGDRVPQLFYADDGLLMANDDQGVHALTACLDVFCARSGMRPNLDPGKTEMIIFSVPPARRALLQGRHKFYIMGGLVRFVQQYKYLGCWFHERRGCLADLPKRVDSVRAATFLMRRQLHALHCARSVRLGIRLYDVHVRPIATYASCVWAVSFSDAAPQRKVVTNALERLHIDFIRGWCHLRGSEPIWILYRELGRLPLHYYWWRDILSFLNRVVALPQASIWSQMMHDNFAAAAGGARNWAMNVQRMMRGLGHVCDTPDVIDLQLVLQGLRSKYDDVWRQLHPFPRQCNSLVRMTTYYRWMDRGDWLQKPVFLYKDYSASKTCAYLRFRLGTHDLGIELGRWLDVKPRHLRICSRCDQQKVDDERHLVFECTAFEHLRAARRHLFTAAIGEDMRAFFGQRDECAVMGYVLDCLKMCQHV